MYLLAGFNADMFEGFKSQGCEVGAWFQVTEKKQELIKPEGIETYSWRDFTLCNLPYVFAQDMDPEFAKNVRDQAYPYFVRMQDRMYWYNFERVDTWIDTVNLLDSMIHFFYSLLKRNEISHVISPNIPHEGPHIILYYVAKEMGIENIIMTQSLVPNAYWILRDFSDFGAFETSIAKVNITIPISNKPEKPFYMKDSSTNKAIEGIKFLSKHLSKTMLNFVPYLLGFRKRSFKKSLFKLDQDRRTNYLKNSIDYDNVNEAEKYVYFPLHLQPEMTTDALGHEYCDQILAIEELIRKLPEDVFVYVKENPKQSGQMREDSFFKRMNALPKVKYLRRDINSFDLIKNSEAVATITGTAGWEALQMGKPVIVFGSAWYRKLPGVFEWQRAFDYQTMQDFQFNYLNLEKASNSLGSYLRKGIVDEGYKPLVENFDAVENARLIVSEVQEFVQDINGLKRTASAKSVK